MSAQWPSPTYTDGDFTVATPVGIPVFSSPIPTLSDEFVLVQDFVQLRANVGEPALGTAHPSSGQTPDYSNYMLVKEGPKQDMGGGLVKWSRTYARIPFSWDSWESYSYTYPGSSPYGAISSMGIGRFPLTLPVVARVRHDYFAVAGSAGTSTYSSAGSIPYIRATAFCAQWTVSEGTAAGSYGGWDYRTQYLSDDYSFYTTVGNLMPSIPSASTYESMIHDAQVNGWNSTITVEVLTTAVPPQIDGSSVWGGQLVAEDSRLTQWLGPIFERQTRYVLAQ